VSLQIEDPVVDRDSEVPSVQVSRSYALRLLIFIMVVIEYLLGDVNFELFAVLNFYVLNVTVQKQD
jgi:hypothetical protein